MKYIAITIVECFGDSAPQVEGDMVTRPKNSRVVGHCVKHAHPECLNQMGAFIWEACEEKDEEKPNGKMP